MGMMLIWWSGGWAKGIVESRLTRIQMVKRAGQEAGLNTMAITDSSCKSGFLGALVFVLRVAWWLVLCDGFVEEEGEVGVSSRTGSWNRRGGQAEEAEAALLVDVGRLVGQRARLPTYWIYWARSECNWDICSWSLNLIKKQQNKRAL